MALSLKTFPSFAALKVLCKETTPYLGNTVIYKRLPTTKHLLYEYSGNAFDIQEGMEVITSLVIEQHAIHRKPIKFGIEKTLKNVHDFNFGK